MLLLKVHKGHLIRSYLHMAIQNIFVPYSYIVLPFSSVKYTPPTFGADHRADHGEARVFKRIRYISNSTESFYTR